MTKMISKKFLTENNLPLITTIINSIDQNKYVYLVVNKLYIPAYESDTDVPHDMLIYGYSEVEEVFYIADCFAGGRYAYKTCTYRELAQAVETITEKDELWFNGCVYLITPKEAEYRFSVYRVKKSMENYLQGQPVTCWNCDNLHGRFDSVPYRFGIDTYEFLHEQVQLLAVKHDRANQIFTLLWDHKKHMKRIIRYLKFEQFYNPLQRLEKEAIILRNLYLKYMIKKEEQILKRMHNVINSMNDTEREIFSKVIKRLNYIEEK